MRALILSAAMLSGCGYLIDESEACRVAAAQGFSACSVGETHVITAGLARMRRLDYLRDLLAPVTQ